MINELPYNLFIDNNLGQKMTTLTNEKEYEQEIEALKIEIKGLKEQLFEEAIDGCFPEVTICGIYYTASEALKAANKEHYAQLFELWEKGEL